MLTAQDANGKTIDGAFSVMVMGDEEPTTMTEVEFSFENPHLVYAILVAIPTVALLGIAFYFLIARRRVV